MAITFFLCQLVTCLWRPLTNKKSSLLRIKTLIRLISKIGIQKKKLWRNGCAAKNTLLWLEMGQCLKFSLQVQERALPGKMEALQIIWGKRVCKTAPNPKACCGNVYRDIYLSISYNLISTCYVTHKSRNAKNKFVYGHVRLYEPQSSKPFLSDFCNIVL